MSFLTTEEKLRHFQEFTMQDARAKSSKLIDEYSASLEKIYEDHKAEKLRRAKFQIKVETESLERNKNKEISKQQLHIRRKLTRTQDELKEKLYLEVKELLLDYMKSSEYEQLLVSQITEAASFAKGEEITIYIDPNDVSLKKHLEELTKATLTVSEYSFLGGTRAVIQGRNILIDNSFETKLSESKSNFTFNGGISNE